MINTWNYLIKNHSSAIAATLCGFFLLIGWSLLHINSIGLGLLILAIGYVIGGFQSTQEGLTTLLQEHELDVDLLMIVAALGAAGLGLWRKEYHLIIDGGVLILIFAISGALEGYALARTEKNIRSLMNLTPDTARIIKNDQQTEIPIKQLQIGDLVLVKPGEMIPTDGIIVLGDSAINESSITGESIPVTKTIHNEVFAGTINGNNPLTLKVNTPPESSLIQRVIRLVQKAQTEAPPSQQFIQKFERTYTKIIVISSIIIATLPPIILNWDWETTIYRTLIFLVVASPCALMAAIMPTLLSGIATGARYGILFKDGAQLETIGKIKAIAFDKTGTLTTGKIQLIEIISTSHHSQPELLKLVATIEQYSEHPIGIAIVENARNQNIEIGNAHNLQSFPGGGIIGEIDQTKLIIGSSRFIQKYHPSFITEHILLKEQLESQGKTIVWIATEKQIIGLISVADTIREEAINTIKKLKTIGIEKIIMLTGDNNKTAKTVAQELGIDQIFAELLPEDKVSVIKELRKEYQTVAMVGDGINDAPALATASVGIAMGIAGSDVALESADIVLMNDSLDKLITGIKLGRRANRIILQNIIFALSFIVILLISNFTGHITLPLGVIGHEGSTVIVTLSGLRLLRNP